MSENTFNKAENTNTDKPKDSMYKAAADAMKAAGDTFKAKAESASGITPEAILERIDKIIADSEHIKKAIDTIGAIDDVSIVDEIVDGINNTVNEREKTNRQIITLLQDMYNSATGKPDEKHNDPDVKKLEKLSEILQKANLPSEYITTIIQKSAQQMFVKPGAAVVMH